MFALFNGTKRGALYVSKQLSPFYTRQFACGRLPQTRERLDLVQKAKQGLLIKYTNISKLVAGFYSSAAVVLIFLD